MKSLLFLISFYLFNLNPIYSNNLISNCDLVASDPFDLQNPLIKNEKIEGAYDDDIINEDYEVLIDSCKTDLENDSENKVRYSFQLARIYYLYEKYELAEPLFQFSYNEGYLASSYYLGAINFHDYIGKFDETSVKYFLHAYEGGFSRLSTLSYLADSYFWLGDYVNAEKYYLIFLKDYIDDDHTDSNYLTDIFSNLASIYYQQDMNAEAEIYLKKTISRYKEHPLLESKSNYLYALQALGTINYDGGGGLPVNYQKAHDFYIELLNEDDDKIYNDHYSRLYIMYRYGLGVDINHKKSLEYNFMGIQWDNSVIYHFNNFHAYYYGMGVEQNIDEAKNILEQIINLKLEEVRDSEEDLQYYKNTAQIYLDDWVYMVETSKIEFREDNICDWMTAYNNVAVNHTYSFQQCLEIAVSGNQAAMEKIAYLYEEGEIVSENFDQAFEWYTKLNNLYPDELSYIYSMADLRLNGKVRKDIDLIGLYSKIIDFYESKWLDSDKNYYESLEYGFEEDISLWINSLYSLAQAYRYGITNEVNYDKSILNFEKVKTLSKVSSDDTFSSRASKNISEIKSLKSGLLVEKDFKKYFPAEFKGQFFWERTDTEQVFDTIKFENLERLGINNYSLKATGVYEDGEIVKFKGELNISDMSFKLSYDYLSYEIPALLEDWDLRGVYLGFFNDDFSRAESWYSKGPGLGSNGILKLVNKNEIEKVGFKSNEDQIEKLNINFGNYYALIIGNQNYDNLEDLNTAIIDAESIASLLENKYNFEILDIIIDGNRSDILSKFNEIKNNLQPYDNLLVYYAGHGHLDSAERGYWLPKDSNTIESDDNTNWISNDDITNLLAKIKAKHILVIADSCFSGSLTFRGVSNELNREKLFANLVTQKTRKAFTSGTLEPVLDGGGQGHSIFASKLLEVLSNNKKILDVNTLFIDIKKAVSSVAQQTPTYGPIRGTGDEGGDFIFVPVY